MKSLLHVGEILRINAELYPDRFGAGDQIRKMTFGQWNERSCRLANGLGSLGLAKGDRVAILAYNCVEWMEIYAACAKSGLVAVPIMFRLAPPEIEYIVNHSEARAFLVADEFLKTVKDLEGKLGAVEHFVHMGAGD